MNISQEYDKLIDKTIKSYLKHFGLKIKNGFIYKNQIAIYTEPIERKAEVLAFLSGLSCVLDSQELWINELNKGVFK